MRRKGTCWANAVAASVCHPRQTAWIPLEDFDTQAQAQTGGFEYIEVFSNRQRCHAAHGSLAPLADEET
jgi:putative transposase